MKAKKLISSSSAFIAFFIAVSVNLKAQTLLTQDETEFNDCSKNWVLELSTNHLEKKPYSGDTHAGYGLFAFKADKNNRYLFKFKGTAPKARFFSYETYEGPFMSLGNYIFDSELLDLDPGLPTYQAANRDYTLIVHDPEDSTSPTVTLNSNKKLALTKSKRRETIKTVMLRAYAPKGQGELTLADVPKVYAFDPESGAPKACPAVHNFEPFEISQQVINLMRGIPSKRTLKFKKPPFWTNIIGLGTNKAVKEYVLNLTRIDAFNDVAVIKFKAPISARDNDKGQVRYWSFCFPNFAKNTTLKCLPDYVAEKDFGKMITVIYGRENSRLREEALKAGHYFIADNRNAEGSMFDKQRVAGFVYRNLLPTEEFDSQAYKGDYLPKGKVCTRRQYLKPNLREEYCTP